MPGSQTEIWKDGMSQTSITWEADPRLREEFILNGNMENGNPPYVWDTWQTPETFEQSGVLKYSGNYSLHIVDSVASYGGCRQLIERISHNKTYTLTFRYYLVSGVLLVYGDDGIASRNATTFATTGSWLLGTVNITIGLSEYFYVIFTNNSNVDTAEFYIDDVSVKEADPSYTHYHNTRDFLCSGKQKGTGTTITDRGRDFKSCGVRAGLAVKNITDSTSGHVVSVTEDTVVTDITFHATDVYEIYKTTTVGTTLATLYLDRRAGRKITDPSETIDGILVDDVDVDEDSIHVFGPGQPE